jgi:tetratricopeptide (TPR) repeat protein
MPIARFRSLPRRSKEQPWIELGKDQTGLSFHPYHLLRRKAGILEFLGCWQQSLDIYTLNRSAVSDPKLVYQTQVDIATCLHSLGKFDLALGLLREAVEYYTRAGDNAGLTHALLKQGNAHYVMGEFGPARDCYLRAIDLSLADGNRVSLSSAYGNLGNIYYFTDNLDEALFYYEKDLEISQHLENKKCLVACLGNIGGIYYSRGLYPKALKWFQKELRLCAEIGDLPSLGMTKFTIGEVLRKMGELSQSLSCLEEAMEIFRRLGDRKGMAHVLSSFSEINAEAGRFQLALKQNAEACAIFREKKITYYLGFYLCSRAELLMSSGCYETVEPLLDEAEGIGRQIGSCEILFNVGIARAKAAAQRSTDEARMMLEAMLKDEQPDEETALVCFELFKLTKREDHRTRALKLYQKLYRATEALEFRSFIERLTAQSERDRD